MWALREWLQVKIDVLESTELKEFVSNAKHVEALHRLSRMPVASTQGEPREQADDVRSIVTDLGHLEQFEGVVPVNEVLCIQGHISRSFLDGGIRYIHTYYIYIFFIYI